jgi:hypothetical protein
VTGLTQSGEECWANQKFRSQADFNFMSCIIQMMYCANRKKGMKGSHLPRPYATP